MHKVLCHLNQAASWSCVTSGIDAPVRWNSQGEDHAAGPSSTEPDSVLVPK